MLGTNEVQKLIEENAAEFKAIEVHEGYLNSFDFEGVFREYQDLIKKIGSPTTTEEASYPFSSLGQIQLKNTVFKSSSKANNGTSNNYLG